MRMIKALAILVAVVGLAAGCARTAPDVTADQDISPGIPIAPDFRIADVPVPAGFEISRPESFVFQNPTFDVGRIKYVGKEPITAVAQFYIDEMPRYGWTLLNVADVDTITLYYDKPDKSATVLLAPKGKGTTVAISFFPKTKAASF